MAYMASAIFPCPDMACCTPDIAYRIIPNKRAGAAPQLGEDGFIMWTEIVNFFKLIHTLFGHCSTQI